MTSTTRCGLFCRIFLLSNILKIYLTSYTIITLMHTFKLFSFGCFFFSVSYYFFIILERELFKGHIRLSYNYILFFLPTLFVHNLFPYAVWYIEKLEIMRLIRISCLNSLCEKSFMFWGGFECRVRSNNKRTQTFHKQKLQTKSIYQATKEH